MRIPMKPVSFMTSRMSVNGTRGNEFHRLAPSAQRTFLLAGRRPAARASVVAKIANEVRRVIVNDVNPLRPAVARGCGRKLTNVTLGRWFETSRARQTLTFGASAAAAA